MSTLICLCIHTYIYVLILLLLKNIIKVLLLFSILLNYFLFTVIIFFISSVKDTHQYADEQLKKNARLRDAFGISEFFIEGSSLDPERKTKEAALAQLKALQVDQAVVQTINDDTSTNKDSSVANEPQ